MAYPHATCAEHERPKRNCSACLDAQVEHNRRLSFPDEVVEPWKTRVRERLGDEWTGSIRPLLRLSEDEPIPDVVFYVVERQGTADTLYEEGRPSFRVTLSGTDADRVLDAAENFDRAYI